MVPRSVVSYVSLAVLGVAVVLQFLVPQLAGYVFLFLLGWLILSVMVFLRPATGRPASRLGEAPGDSPTPPNLPSGLGFCLYCAQPILPGAAQCPACGHTLPRV
jgi:hypothetical protein